MRRAVLSWSLVFLLFCAAFVASVAALNADLLSAHGFARSYLDALARHDSGTALATDGVRVPAAAADLLVDDAMGQLDEIRFVGETESDGVYTVRFAVELATGPATTEFQVERVGSTFGLFTTWRFAESPLAILDLSVLNDSRFSANGVEAVASGAASPFAVFAPGSYLLDHESTYLEADEVDVPVTEPGTEVAAELEVEGNREFNPAAESAVAGFLAECATQQLLFPTGCPFGFDIANRIQSDPTWSIVTYPQLNFEPGETQAEWQSSLATGTAHLVVEVKSLFDGSVTSLDEDVDFTSRYTVTVLENDELLVTAQFD